jgi:hypothetical protein
MSASSLKTTIAGELLLLAGFCFLGSSQKLIREAQGLSPAFSQPSKTKIKSGKYGPPTKIGTLKNPSISESSGLVASRLFPGAYWTHNDSGDGPFIYAFDSEGMSLGVVRVAGARAHDWEDIAAGPGPQRDKSYLYIGDIGDNNDSRSEVVVYRIPEPVLTAADRATTTRKPRVSESAEPIRLRYPDGAHDAEALLVHPFSGNLYIVTKVALANPMVYEAEAPFDTGKVITMKSLGELKVPSLFGGIITGGNISPDGRMLALCDYFDGYELVLPATSNSFDDIWKQRMVGFDLGKRNQGEAITYRLDGKAFLATSEGKSSVLIQVVKR